MSTVDLAQAARLLKVHPKTLQKLARFGLVCCAGRSASTPPGCSPSRVRGLPTWVANVYTKAFKAALDRAGIEDFQWHDLRHTFATWHRKAGTPTHEQQKLGGWKTGVMVERYAHLAPEALQGAASRLDAISGYAAATQKAQGASG